MANENTGITVMEGKVVEGKNMPGAPIDSDDLAIAEGRKPAKPEAEAKGEEKEEAEAEGGAEGDEGKEGDDSKTEAKAKGAKAEGEEEETEEKSGDDAKPKKTPWQMRRISELTQKLKRTTAENEELRKAFQAKENAEAAEASEESGTTVKPKVLTETDVIKRAEKLAEEIANQRESVKDFNRVSNNIYDKGVAEFKDFADQVAELRDTVGPITPQLVEALSEHEFPHRALYELCNDKDEASRIMSLSPIKMAAAIAKLKGIEPKTEKKISSAPPPIRPVKSNAKPEKTPEEMNAKEFADWRDKQEQERRAARYN